MSSRVDLELPRAVWYGLTRPSSNFYLDCCEGGEDDLENASVGHRECWGLDAVLNETQRRWLSIAISKDHGLL